MSRYRHGLGAVLYFSIIISLIILLMNLDSIVQTLKDYISREEDIRIDWHNWSQIDEEEQRTGIGEHGEGTFLWTYPSYTKQINDTHGYNGYLSDKIALNRSLKDLRPKKYVNISRICNKKFSFDIYFYF